MITNTQLWKQNADMADVREIGEILKKKRQEQLLSIEAIHGKTYISLKYLVALEEGDLSLFPAEVYYISTLRQYADFLGVDPTGLLEIYRSKAVQVQKEQPARNETRKSKSIKIYLAIVILAGIIVFALLLRQSSRSARDQYALPSAPQQQATVSTPVAQPSLPNRTVAVSTAAARPPVQNRTVMVSTAAARSPVPNRGVAVSTKTATSTSTFPASRRAAAAPAAGKQLKLNVKIIETSWVKLLADNNVLLFEGTLLAGSEKEWAAHDRFYLVVGYAPGVQLRLNDKAIDVTRGAKQDINQLTLTWDDVNSRG